jgi:DNA-binding NtrC family response regulator
MQSILLVDDDRECSKAMKKTLERQGYCVTIVGNGREALDTMSNSTVDLVVTELRMPEIGGVELLVKMQKKPIKAPVIFLTAYGDVESYLAVMNLGAFDYLSKPADSEELLRVIRQALKIRDSSRRAQTPKWS